MKNYLNLGLAALAVVGLQQAGNAQTFGDWDNPRINTNFNVGIGTPDNTFYRLDIQSDPGRAGLRSTGDDYGVHGISNNNVGVLGWGPDQGVFGSSQNIGVFGEGSNFGVQGYAGSNGTGVYGSGQTAVRGESNNTNGSIGVHGSGPDVGVYGESDFAWGVWGVGNAGIGVRGESTNGYAGYFIGLTWCTQGVWSGSDARFKKNVEPISNALSTVRKINGLTYEFKNEEFASRNFTDGRSYGFLAQDLQKVMPELVKEDEDGYLGINYSLMTPLLVEAVKEQQDIIDEQAQKLEDLETALAQMQAQLSDMQHNNAGNLSPQTGTQSEAAPEMEQNRPNPFQESTTIDYYLPTSVSKATLVVYNAEGIEVMRSILANRGYSNIRLNGSELEAGNYVYTIFADGEVVSSKQMVLTH